METMLDELIRHCEEVAKKNEKFCDKKRGDKYRQLVEWLKDYKQLLERESCEVSQCLVKDSQGFSQEPCEDAISRQAVLDAMYNLCNTGENLQENPWRDNPHIDAITDEIDKLPSVTPQPKTEHWVSVSERLPEEETEVLICNRNGDIALSRGSYSTEVENDFIWYTSGWRFGKVIAWMPLPEPYKTESEE